MKKQFVVDDEIVDVDVVEETPSFVLFKFNGEEYSVNLGRRDDVMMVLNHKGKNRKVITSEAQFVVDGHEFTIESGKKSRNKSKGNVQGHMNSPMPGKILKIFVKVGDTVTAGTPILVMEAMKMEHTIKASGDGVIEKLFFKEGDQVTGGVELVKLC